MLGKKSGLTYEDVKLRYEMFRARCLTKKPAAPKKTKKESGCVKPLYGTKSKCVINIVPKSKKCNTFNIDKQCILRKNWRNQIHNTFTIYTIIYFDISINTRQRHVII